MMPKIILRFYRNIHPSDYIFTEGYSLEEDFLFSDGTIGRAYDHDFDIEEHLDKDQTEKDLNLNGKRPIGNMYIDRWDRDGKFYQGGCFLYYDREKMKNYCDRNNEPYPVKRIPKRAIDEIESGLPQS